MSLSLVARDAIEPITFAEVKQQELLSEDITDQDRRIDAIIIPAARDRAELATQRALMPETWDWTLNRYPSEAWLEMPKPPLVSVTSVKYLDTAGVQQTWAVSNYVVLPYAGPRCRRGKIILAYGVAWPTTLARLGCITIRFVCGHVLTSEIAPMLRDAMLMDAATLYNNRGGEAPMSAGVAAIYWNCRSYSTQLVDD